MRDFGGDVAKEVLTERKVLRYVDLEEQLIIEDSGHVGIVAHVRPALDAQAVTIGGSLDQVGAISVGPPLWGRSGDPVPNQVPTTAIFARPNETSPDDITALICVYRI